MPGNIYPIQPGTLITNTENSAQREALLNALQEVVIDVTEIEDEEIRDTSPYSSEIATAYTQRSFTFVFVSTLDQSVSIQTQGSVDGIIWFDIGDPTIVEATSQKYETITEAWYQFKCISTCSVSPTTGSLIIKVLRRS